MKPLLSPYIFGVALFVSTTALSWAADRIYPDVSAANADITAALKEAAGTKRRVIVDFGGDW